MIVHIATSGRPSLLLKVLETLQASVLPQSLEYVHIVENGEASEVAEKIDHHGPFRFAVRLDHVATSNKSAALNVALDAADDDQLVVYLDDDVTFAADLLQVYAAACDAQPRAFFGGPVQPEYDVEPEGWMKMYMPKSAVGWTLGSETTTVSKPVFLGFNWAAYAGDLKRIGGFNTQVGPGAASGATGQDKDAQRRLIEAGLPGVYLPNALVHHYVPENRCTPAWLLQRAYRQGLGYGAQAAIDLKQRMYLPLLCSLQLARAHASRPVARLTQSTQLRFDSDYRQQMWKGVRDGLHSRLAQPRSS